MKFWRHNLRFLAALQLLPALESGEETLVGGQAVLEGVMMRSPHAWGIAVRRRADVDGNPGKIELHSEPLERPSEKRKWMGWPVVRGVVTLGHAMTLGFRALKFSANIALEDETGETPSQPAKETSTVELAQSHAALESYATPSVQVESTQDAGKKKSEVGGWAAAFNIIFSLAFFIVFYKLLPLTVTTVLKNHFPLFGNFILFNLVDGLIRIVLFLSFIWGISLWQDIRRVYQYHGAEHKTVFAFEADSSNVTVPQAQSFVTWHPRCGTSFLMTVMLISIVFYTAIPVTTFAARLIIRVALLPVIAGVSYELIRFAAKRRSSLFALLTAPGLWLQRITTQPPSDDQVECAIAALNHAMTLEKAQGGELVIA